MDLNTLKELASFGGTGVAIFLAYILWQQVGATMRLMGNHLNHSTKALTKLECAIQKLCKTIK